MANKTVYPYGVGGELPAGIALVNDLKTGGVDKALTAEQGKVIGSMLIESRTYLASELTPFKTNLEYKADAGQIGKNLANVETYTGTDTASTRTYRIPVSGAYQITYTKFNSGYDYGCLFLDASDVVISGVVSNTSHPQPRTIGVPEGAATFIWTLFLSEGSCVLDYYKLDSLEQGIEEADANIETLYNEIGKITIPQTTWINYTHYKDSYQFKADSSQVGKALSDVPTLAGSNYLNVKIPISGYSKLSFVQYNSGYQYGSLILDQNDVVLMGIISPSGESARRNVNIPEGAAYLLASFAGSSYNKNVILYKDNSVLTRIDALENNTPTTVASGCGPVLKLGRLNSTNTISSSSAFYTTEPIFGAFYLELKTGWQVYEGHLVDKEGNMVCYQHYHPEVTTVSRRSSMRIFSMMNVVPEFGLRLVICKSDQSAIPDNFDPFVSFVSLADAGLHRWIPDDLPNYERALRRIAYIQSPRWIALRKVPNGYPSSSSTTATNPQNTYFDLAGNMAFGVPYSDVAETRTYVPNNVSLKTFMTAVMNKRSLLYTEELHQGVSKYGRTYQQGNRRCYYGEVCSGFTAWVMGLKTLYLSYAYNDNTVPGLSTVAGANASNVRPLDLLWWNGHVAIVSDVLLDEFGNRKFIVIAEMTSPHPFRTIYTPAQFDSRMSSGEIHRWTGWDNLPEPDEARDLSQYMLGDVRQEIQYNPDIMTYAGDYAAFAEGSKIYLNARRNSIYTGVELYKDDELLQTIDITGLSPDNILTSNDEDWVVVNLTGLNLTYGKYKARLTDGTNTTDYTYFEVVDITFTAEKTGSTVTAYFSSNEGTPVSLERVKTNGFAEGYRPITAEMVEAGQATAFNVKSGYPNLLLLVSGDYGDVCKTIPIPTS